MISAAPLLPQARPAVHMSPRAFRAPERPQLSINVPVPVVSASIAPDLPPEILSIPVPAPPTPSAIALPAPALKTDNLRAASAAQEPVISAGVQTAGFSGASSLAVSDQQRQTVRMTGGFGAASTETARAPAIAVARAGFGDAAVAALAAASPPAGAGGMPGNGKPVQILAKPRPAYSAEARRLQIEGEVLIEILFAASGEARVIRLLRGLGHGLDENALAAARAIRFRPAERAGAPVDSTATIHILFQLAY